MRKFKIIFLLTTYCLLLTTAFAYAEPIAVIVNKSNSQDELSIAELNRIYKGKMQKWPDGTKIVPINREFTAPIREAFSKAVHGKSLEKMKAYWYEQQYKGVRPPMIQQSSVAVKRMVSNVPGGIGYIYLSEVDETVKVLKIEGLNPGDEGYKLE